MCAYQLGCVILTVWRNVVEIPRQALYGKNMLHGEMVLELASEDKTHMERWKEAEVF